jgi:hypothetical protein
MDKHKYADDKIFDYLDGNLTPQEKAAFDQQLQADTSLRLKVEELRQLETLWRELKVEEPSKTFTLSVMNNLEKGTQRTGFGIRNSIFLLSGIMIAVGVCALLLSLGFFDSDQTTIDLNTLALKNKYVPQTLPAISLSGKLLVNIVIFLNLILAFLVLDRAVLKPLFHRRMKLD